MSLKIHGIAASRASRPLWVALELGLAFEHVPLHYKDGATHTPEFLALNPNGHIPVLQDEGVVVWESMACALYLADNYKGPDGLNLAAQTKAESAEILRWTFWVVTECEKDALTILMHTLVMPADRRKPELVAQAVSRLAGPLRVIEQHLAGSSAGTAYLAGERFTVADIAGASVLAWVKPAPELLAACPATAAGLTRCLDRPAQLQLRAMSRKG